MLHKAWNSKGEMPYRFPRSSVKFQGHTVQSITDFDPNWAFPDYRPVAAFKSLRFALLYIVHNKAFNCSYVSCCVYLDTVLFNNVIQYLSELTGDEEKLEGEEVPCRCLRTSVKFWDHLGWKIDYLNPVQERILGWSQLWNPSDMPCLCYLK